MIKLVAIFLTVICITVDLYSDNDLTSPDGNITYSSSLSPYYGTKAFDDVIPPTKNGRWLADASNLPNVYVTYTFDTPGHAVGSYRIYNTTSSSVTTRSIRDFTLQASNDGQEWTILDSQEAQTWTDAEPRLFIIDNTNVYTQYKLMVSTNNGASDYVSISEMELFAYVAGPPEKAFNPSPTNEETGVRIHSFFTWTSSEGTYSNSIYFTENETITEADFIVRTNFSKFATEELEYGTAYRWRVDSENATGVTTGDVWQFTTVVKAPTSFIAEEDFEELNVGEISGQGGTTPTGWQASWSAVSQASVVNTNIYYKNGEIFIDGGQKALQIKDSESNSAVERLIAKHENGYLYFSFLVKRLFSVGDELLSVSFRYDEANRGYSNCSGVNFGYPNNYINAESYAAPQGTANVRVSSGVSIEDDKTYFIVVRLSRTGDNLYYCSSEILVDPTTFEEPSDGWTQAIGYQNTSDDLAYFNIRSSIVGNGETYIIDNIRVGRSYESVDLNSPSSGSLFIVK
jgi:hypothetical protein